MPVDVLKRQFGKAVYGEVLEKVLRETSSKAIEEKKIKSIPGASGLSPARSSIIKENAWDWATNIWEDMLS